MVPVYSTYTSISSRVRASKATVEPSDARTSAAPPVSRRTWRASTSARMYCSVNVLAPMRTARAGAGGVHAISGASAHAQSAASPTSPARRSQGRRAL